MNDKSKKHFPRRLFSFDSLRSRRTQSRDSHDGRATFYSQVDAAEDPFGDDGGATGQEIWLDDKDDIHNQSGHSKLLPDQLSRASTPDSLSSTASPSRARWDKIRQHVLLSAANAAQGSPQPQPTPLASSPPPRSTTPKPSRFPRLGFRQVVEQAKEDTDIFTNEIRRACWMSRYPEYFKSKGERDVSTVTMNSSTLYLPFMSNASGSGTSGISSGITRRQDTTASQSSLPSPFTPSIQRSVPTIKPLWQLLMTYATPSSDGTLRCAVLPHETLVLSVLQGPFLKLDRLQDGIPDERRLAMESFEIIFRTWFPDNEVGERRILQLDCADIFTIVLFCELLFVVLQRRHDTTKWTSPARVKRDSWLIGFTGCQVDFHCHCIPVPCFWPIVSLSCVNHKSDIFGR